MNCLSHRRKGSTWLVSPPTKSFLLFQKIFLALPASFVQVSTPPPLYHKMENFERSAVHWGILFKIIYYILAALGPRCCAWAFSGCGEWGLLSSCGEWASHCSDFLRSMGYRHAGSAVVVHRT